MPYRRRRALSVPSALAAAVFLMLLGAASGAATAHFVCTGAWR